MRLLNIGGGRHTFKLPEGPVKRSFRVETTVIGYAHNGEMTVHLADTLNFKLLNPVFIDEIEKMLSGFGREAVFHAHIGSGELHLRPILNLKNPVDNDLFRKIGIETALLVKKYKGSLSGEHGDGRLRGEFIPLILGEQNYILLKEIVFKYCLLILY